jgi:hypothetical protein
LRIDIDSSRVVKERRVFERRKNGSRELGARRERVFIGTGYAQDESIDQPKSRKGSEVGENSPIVTTNFGLLTDTIDTRR